MIKKTSETTPTMASVVNTYSTSNEDTYSCDYINAKVGKILWTNDSIAEISTTNITVDDMSEYSIIEIAFRQHLNDTSKITTSRMIKSAGNGMMQFNEVGSGYWVIRTREIAFTNNTTINIKQGYEVVSGTVSSRNNVCIPIYVIGYKTELS